MAIRILTDSFVGSPEEFYSLVIEEINLRALPGIEYSWIEEVESEKKFFNKGEKARALRVAFKTEWITVFAIQIGSCFFISTRISNRFHDPTQRPYLYEVFMFTFENTVDRSARRALVRLMENQGITAPNYLSVNDNAPEPQQVTQ